MAILGKEAATTLHPKYWPYSDTDQDALVYYHGTSASGRTATGANFWATVFSSTFGAYNDVAKSADTYYTYADISDSHGVMGSIVLPHPTSTGSAFYTIKLTTDGVVEEFRTLTAALNTDRRPWIGFAKASPGTDDVRTQSRGGYGSYRYVVSIAGLDNYDTVTLTHAQDSITEGMPVHPFETSLKVEVKCSVASTTTAHKENGGVFVYSHANL